ncbi:hypothetical protein BG004_002364, partial [Podila humilis]
MTTGSLSHDGTSIEEDPLREISQQQRNIESIILAQDTQDHQDNQRNGNNQDNTPVNHASLEVTGNNLVPFKSSSGIRPRFTSGSLRTNLVGRVPGSAADGSERLRQPWSFDDFVLDLECVRSTSTPPISDRHILVRSVLVNSGSEE